MWNQEQIHRYFNHLTGAKRIEFLYGLLHLCQPLELRYLGTCLEEIARKDYEYLYHAEQKTNLSAEENNPELPNDDKFDLTDQLVRAHTIVDIALLWAKNRTCAVRLFRRLKASESVQAVDLLLERDDLDERTMDEILIIFCLAANHPAFSFDMRTQMSQIFKDLEKRQRKMKLLQTVHHQDETDDETLDESIYPGQQISASTSISKTNTLSVHASPLLTRLTAVNFDTDSTPMRVLVKADWSDNNSTLAWKTPTDIRSFHLQLSNIVYHDDMRLERLMNISAYLRDIGTPNEPDVELMKKNIGIYLAHLVYFSSYISTISTLAKFFNSSLKLVDAKQRLFNSNTPFEDSFSPSSSSPSVLTPLQCEFPHYDAENRSLGSPRLSSSTTKSKQQLDVAKQARSMISAHHSTQTGFEVRCEETQTDRTPGPGHILAEHQDYLRRYSMEQLANLKASDLVADGLDAQTAQLLCGALDDLKPMSIHLSQGNKSVRSPISIPIVSTSSSPPPPLLDAALMSVVQQPNRSSPSSFDRNQFEQILMNFPGIRPPMSSSPSPKLPKGGNNHPVPPSSSSSNQHHVPLLTAHSFLYNPVESCIVPIAMPPGFSLSSPDFMRLFTPNMTMGPTNNSNGNSRSTSGNTPPESSQQGSVSSSSTATTNSRPPHYRQRYHQAFDPNQFASNRPSHPSSYRQKACYTCGDLGHLAFACPEQYLSDSNYSSHHRTGKTTHLSNISDGYKLDYRPRQSLSSNHHHYQRQMRSNSKTKGN